MSTQVSKISQDQSEILIEFFQCGFQLFLMMINCLGGDAMLFKQESCI